MAVLPDWLTPLPDAQTMRSVDGWAIEQRGVASLELMESAGTALLRAAERISPDGPVTICCGKGNNGGDGLVLARLLRELGREVTVVCAAPPQELQGDARANLERLPGPAPVRLDGSPWAQGGGSASEPSALPGDQYTALVVDALLGTGFAGEPRGEIARAIELLADVSAPVLSVDVPSGVDASSGEVAGVAVRASATVTFHAAKPGLWVAPGKDHAGDVEVVDIGIPRGAPLEADVGLIGGAIATQLPTRDRSWTKFRSGQVVIAGGSRGLSGAPMLCARSSMRAGAGYVIACVPRSLAPILAAGGTPELMTRGLDEEDSGGFAEDAAAEVLDLLQRGGALALGPGLGRTAGAVALARRLAREASVPLVLDADGLNAHAGALGELAERAAATVLTPHAGEMARLLASDSAAVEDRRLHSAREAAEQARAVVVLKGDDTLIAEPGGRVAVSGAGTPALATAGTGDVLTGVIAALLAQGLDAFTAAAAGVWLHGNAGRLAAQRLGAVEGVIATDVIAALPSARAHSEAHS